MSKKVVWKPVHINPRKPPRVDIVVMEIEEDGGNFFRGAESEEVMLYGMILKVSKNKPSKDLIAKAVTNIMNSKDQWEMKSKFFQVSVSVGNDRIQGQIATPYKEQRAWIEDKYPEVPIFSVLDTAKPKQGDIFEQNEEEE